MRVRGPEFAVLEMLENLGNRSAVNESIATIDILDADKIPGFLAHVNAGHDKASFDFQGFLYNNDFQPAIHLQRNKHRLLPFLKSAFSEDELSEYHLTEETLVKEQDIPLLRNAIILWGVGATLDYKHINIIHRDVEKSTKGLSNEVSGPIIVSRSVEAMSISAGELLKGKLPEMMECMRRIDFIEATVPGIRDKIQQSKFLPSIKADLTGVCQSLLTDSSRLGLATVMNLVKTVEEFVDKPNHERAQACRDFSLRIDDEYDTKYPEIHNISTCLYTVGLACNPKFGESHGLFSTKETKQEAEPERGHKPPSPNPFDDV